MGRFITRDPSGAEANLYLYASANPVNYTDPSGLLSKREVASGLWLFGLPNPDNFESFLNETENVASAYGVNPKWGLIAALLDAVPGDRLEAYNVDIWGSFSSLGDLSVFGRPRFYQVTNMRIGSSPRELRELYIKTLNSPPGEAFGGFIPRANDARYYILYSQSGEIKRYIDGSTNTDYPDFKISTLNIADSIKEGIKLLGVNIGKLGCLSYTRAEIVDRYGQVYHADIGNIGFGFTFATIGEGWVTTDIKNRSYIPDAATLRNNIQDVSIGQSISLAWGASYSYSPSTGAWSGVGSAGLQGGISILDLTFIRYDPEQSNPSLGWDWANQWEKGAYGSPPTIFRNTLSEWSTR